MIDEHSKEIQEVQQQAGTVVQTATNIAIASDADIEGASVVLKSIADTKKSIEERRQFFVKPLNDQVKKINDLFKELAAPLVSADTLIRGKLSEYRSVQAEIARKEQERLNRLAEQQQERLNKKAEKEGVEAPKIIAPVVTQLPTKVGNVATRKVWAFEITDSALVPRQYLVIDDKAIRSAIQAGAREIAGVRVYQKEELVVR